MLYYQWGDWPGGLSCYIQNQKIPGLNLTRCSSGFWKPRPIIVNFSFIVISCTQSSMQHAVIIWLFGKIFEKITTLCFVLSLYDKIFILFVLLCIPGTCVFYYSWKKKFLHSWSNNQLSCDILRKILMMWAGDYEQIINCDWPHLVMRLSATFRLK